MKRVAKACEAWIEDQIRADQCGRKPARYRILADSFLCESCWRTYQIEDAAERQAMRENDGGHY